MPGSDARGVPFGLSVYYNCTAEAGLWETVRSRAPERGVYRLCMTITATASSKGHEHHAAGTMTV